MKLNGALKPRQGASKEGSSPGVVYKRYRVKRYFKVNENVVKRLPLNTCGITNKCFNENNKIDSNYLRTNNQQQQSAATLTEQLEQIRCVETLRKRSTSTSFSRNNCSTLIRFKKHINFATQNTTQYRVTAVRESNASFHNLNNRKSKNNNLKSKVLAEATPQVVVKGNSIKRKTTIQIDLQQEAVINITTRQTMEDVKNNSKRLKTTEVIPKQMYYNVNENNSHNNRYSNSFKKVDKFFLIPQINSNPNLRIIILRLFIKLKLFFASIFLPAIKNFYGKPSTDCAGSGSFNNRISEGSPIGCRVHSYKLVKMIRVSQLLMSFFERICFKNARGVTTSIALYIMVYVTTAILMPPAVVGEDGDTFFPINGIETTTPEFDYASRGQKKFGDKCDNTLECGFPGSICDPKKKSCQCTEDLPVTNHIDKCGKEAAVNESCFFNEQCEAKYFQTECRDQRCVCRFDMTPIWLKDGSVECKGRGDKRGPETYIDPAMIGVLIGMALMFIIICVVLRLFSQARWRENRTIFNTPNPRLMNVSLLRESKLLHGQERRGSRMSVRAPSRQPSMASLRPHSPNPSLGKTGSRSNSHGSNASATSLRSTRSNCVSPAGITVGNNSHHERKGSTYHPQQHHPSQQKLQSLQQEEEQHLTQTNIISNPVAETVTVEMIEPEK